MCPACAPGHQQQQPVQPYYQAEPSQGFNPWILLQLLALTSSKRNMSHRFVFPVLASIVVHEGFHGMHVLLQVLALTSSRHIMSHHGVNSEL